MLKIGDKSQRTEDRGQKTEKNKIFHLNAVHQLSHAESGLILIELLVVVLIIGLLTIIALPTFSKFGSNTRLKSTTQQIDALLRMAKNFATTQNSNYRVMVYPRDTSTPNQIAIEKCTLPDCSSGIPVEKTWIASPLIEIADVSQQHGSVQTIKFFATGTADPRSIHIIQRGTLINGSPYNPGASYDGLSKAERVKCFTVTTDNVTGRAKIYHYGRNTPWAPGDL